MSSGGPARSTTSIAIARPSADPNPDPQLSDPRPPTPQRAPWRSALGWLAHQWWKVFSFLFVGNYLSGLALALVQGGVPAFLTALTSWGLLAPAERAHPVAFWVGLVVLAGLAAVGFLEERREQRAAQRAQEEHHRRVREASARAREAEARAEDARQQAQEAHERLDALQAHDAQRQADSASEPQGPPDDVALLPAAPRFFGRDEDREWLLARLRQGGATAITALGGMGGIGKTALAAIAVAQMKEEGRFPDGVAVVLCQGLSDAAEVLRRVLARFDPYRRTPGAQSLAELVDIALLMLRGKDALVVLDNVEPQLSVADVVAPLRAAGVAVLLTARQTLPHSIVPIEASRALDLLTPEDALDVFAASLGRQAAEFLTPVERAAGERIVATLDRHTLAVKLAGAYAADGRRDLEVLARELEDPERALDLPEGEAPEAVKRVFARSVEALSPDARRLFAALAAFATVEFGRQAVQALGAALGQSTPEVNVNLLVLRALVEASPLEQLPRESDRERLRLHPLLRAFADGTFHRWPPFEQRAAFLAVARWFAEYAETYESQPTVLGSDERNMAGALEWAYAVQGHDGLVVRLVHGMRRFWLDRGRWLEGLRYLPWGIAAAQATVDGDDRERLRVAQLDMAGGQIFAYTGRMEDAEQAMQRSLAGYQSLRERRGEGAVLSALGYLEHRRGRLSVAYEYLHRALSIARDVQDRQVEGVVLNELGLLELRRGALPAAEIYLGRSLDVTRAIQDRTNEGVAAGIVGMVALQRERLDEAEDHLQQALAIARERDVQDRQGEGVCLSYLGRVRWRRGLLAEAADFLRQGLAILREVQDRRWEARTLCASADVAEAQGDFEGAEAFARASLARAMESESGPEIADALVVLGRLLAERRGKVEEGCQMLTEATRRYGQMSLPDEQKAYEIVQRLGCHDMTHNISGRDVGA
jgi:tetratricopeptide (TPR) repeat protein